MRLCFQLSTYVGAALSVVSSAFACDPIQTSVATTPAMEQSPVRLKAAIERGQNSVANVDVVIAGDSIANRWSHTYSRDFPKKTVHNFGVSGDRTQQLLWRLGNLAPQITPGTVVVIIGTNNLTDRSSSACGIAAGVVASVEAIKAKWPASKVYLFPVLPRGEGFSFREDIRLSANEQVSKRFQNDGRVRIIHVNEDELTCRWAENDCANFDGGRLHPTPAGYALLTRYLNSAMGKTK